MGISSKEQIRERLQKQEKSYDVNLNLSLSILCEIVKLVVRL